MEQAGSTFQSVEPAIIEEIAGIIDALNLYADIVAGPMPPDNGIAMVPAGGSTTTTFAKKNALCYLNVVINGKHKDQSTVYDALCTIHAALSKVTDFDSGDGYQITSIETNAAPSYLDTTPGNQFIFGSSIKVNYYRR